MEGRPSAARSFEQLKKMMETQVTPEELLGIKPEDLLGEYNYAIDQASLSARTATQLEMQKYAAQQQIDKARYEAEEAIKQQMADALVYGTGVLHQTAQASQASQIAYDQMLSRLRPPEEKRVPRSGKEQCPVLIRLLTELFANPAFSLKYRNLAVLA